MEYAHPVFCLHRNWGWRPHHSYSREGRGSQLRRRKVGVSVGQGCDVWITVLLLTATETCKLSVTGLDVDEDVPYSFIKVHTTCQEHWPGGYMYTWEWGLNLNDWEWGWYNVHQKNNVLWSTSYMQFPFPLAVGDSTPPAGWADCLLWATLLHTPTGCRPRWPYPPLPWAL